MSAANNIYLPLKFNQLLDLIKQLPKKQKQQLMEALQQDEPAAIPEWQKEFVRNSIKKYKAHPELLVNEEDAWKIIDAE